MKKSFLILLPILFLSGCTITTEIPIQGNKKIFEDGMKCMEAQELFVIKHITKNAIWSIEWHCETLKRIIKFD